MGAAKEAESTNPPSQAGQNTTSSRDTSPVLEPDPDLPAYYDSEPSSQPPKYHRATTSTSSASSSPTPLSQTRPKLRSQPQDPNRGSGAPAATIAALLAPPSAFDDETRKKSLRERWKAFRARKFGDEDWEEGEKKSCSGAARGG
ncbi:hypothetical protein IQ07DRAFT_372201 [Pyrenochaeta sp. DS3sAY3a]|nr:hypothetical protein IQ07DRAFT_372201 [Pyrenochaeta sp. DS3sAY3a]